MTTLDCRLISPSSPLRPLIIDPVQEGFYALFHAHAIQGGWTNPQALKDRVTYAALSFALLLPVIGSIALQILNRRSISYQGGLHKAIQEKDLLMVQWYLNIGVSPNNLEDTKPLLFQTTNRVILQSLLDHGADPKRSYREQTFLEHLVENDLEDLAVKSFDESYLKEEVYHKAIDKPDHRFAAFLIRMGAPHTRGRENLRPQRYVTTNPLEPLILMGDETGVLELFDGKGFEQFIELEKELKRVFPRIQTDWIWKPLAKHLIATEREPLAHDLVNRKLLQVEPLLTKEEFEFSPVDYRHFLIRMGYQASKEEVSDIPYRSYMEESPLETIVATQNKGRLRTFVESRTFNECYEAFLELKLILPRINTDWMWNALYDIPNGHYEQARGVQQEQQLTEDPPVKSSLGEMMTIFDQINFSDPKGPHYVPPEVLKDTLDNAKPVQYTPTELKRGFRNIIQAICQGTQVYRLTPTQRQGYCRQVQWILYYLKQGKKEESQGWMDWVLSFFRKSYLERDKANLLVEMAKTCLMCPGRYNEVFDAAIKRLKGDPIVAPTFERQVIQRFADLRSRTITAIAFKEAKGCIHARENLVYYLHRKRAIVETRPENYFSYRGPQGGESEHYKFTQEEDAFRVFDREYTPRALAQVFFECVREGRKRTQSENDFNLLLFDAMVDAYAKKFPAIQALEARMKRRTTGGALFEDQRLSRAEVERLFKPIHPEYHFPEEGLTVAEYFSLFKKSFLGVKIRPLNDDYIGYLLPEVIHPFILGELLCEMGHLRRFDAHPRREIRAPYVPRDSYGPLSDGFVSRL